LIENDPLPIGPGSRPMPSKPGRGQGAPCFGAPFCRDRAEPPPFT
jgi:hypothetical protein